jgi:hypothetical protein
MRPFASQRPSLSPGECMDRGHSGQVCGDMVDTVSEVVAAYRAYAMACERTD